uniref:hypothetical protein n=1 Tax=Prevotella sp. TaxID=59823 RepID=UPI00402889E1
MFEQQKIGKSASFVEKYAKLLVTCTFQKCRFDTDTERLIHGMVMGKNSYLFCRDLNTCKRAAMMYSLFGACKVRNKNPGRWLCHVLKNIKTTPKNKLYTLLPEFWEDDEQKMNLEFSQIKV